MSGVREEKGAVGIFFDLQTDWFIDVPTDLLFPRRNYSLAPNFPVDRAL